jgi:putative redox protein
VVVSGAASAFKQDVVVGPHRFGADEPKSFGGQDAHPGPYELLLAALGSCTSMTLGVYARRKQWPLESVEVSLKHSRIHAKDCEECAVHEHVVMLDHIDTEIVLVGPALSEEQRAQLLAVAKKCPVHKTLTSHIHIKTRVREASDQGARP